MIASLQEERDRLGAELTQTAATLEAQLADARASHKAAEDDLESMSEQLETAQVRLVIVSSVVCAVACKSAIERMYREHTPRNTRQERRRCDRKEGIYCMTPFFFTIRLLAQALTGASLRCVETI